MEIFLGILAVIAVFGIAINIHEFGHFIVARMFGMRVEAYSFFGLGPRIWGFKRGHTDYRISAIPLGAYVKLYGDESNSGLEAKDADGQNVPESELYELRPRWQKFLVMLGGPLMNFVLALAIPFGAALMYGVEVSPAPIVGSIKEGGAAEKAGIKVGDRIIAFEGKENPSWQAIVDDGLLIPEKEVPITVERGGKPLTLTISPTKVTKSGQTAGILEMFPDDGVMPVVVGKIEPTMPAANSGLQTGDWITSVNGKAIRTPDEMKIIVGEAKDQPILLVVKRGGETKEISTNAKLDDNNVWRIGIGFKNPDPVTEPVGIAGAATHAVNENIRILRMTGKALGQVFAGQRAAGDTLQGPVGISRTIYSIVPELGWAGFFSILTAISLSLGIMNLLPIPMLDGGQIMVLGIEKVMSWFGKTLSMAFRERIQLTGLAIVLLLMVFTLFNDVSKLFK